MSETTTTKMSTELRIGMWIGLALLSGFLLYVLAPVLTPFLAAVLLAYLGDPITDRLQRLKMSRSVAVTLVFVVIIAISLVSLLLLIPLLEGQFSAAIKRLPGYIDLLREKGLPWFEAHLGVDVSQYDLIALRAALGQHMQTVGGVAAGFLATLSSSSLLLVEWLANLVLVPVITFYLLRDWDHLLVTLHEMLPRRIEATVSSLVIDADAVLGAFLKGQLLVMISLGVIYSIGLMLIGLDFALLIGMLAGLVSFVPYLGLIVGILSAGIAALVQFTDLFSLLLVALVFGIGQIAETVALTPLFVGDKIGLHPVAVIFAVLAGGSLFGFFGILLALPVAAVLMVLVRRSYQAYLESDLYHG